MSLKQFKNQQMMKIRADFWSAFFILKNEESQSLIKQNQPIFVYNMTFVMF